MAERLLIENFWNPEELRDVLKTWPAEGWRRHEHDDCKGKRALGRLGLLPDAARRVLMQLNAQRFIDQFSKHFGFELIPDPWIVTRGEMFGGGLHETSRGGFLNPHVDYNWHAGVYRRINLLLYLNDWKEGDGGELELGRELIEPVFNRCVVFETSESSWHGHPNPWNADEPRRSLAVYYYSGSGEDVSPHSTIYRKP